jgi:hypothetical protein
MTWVEIPRRWGERCATDNASGVGRIGARDHMLLRMVRQHDRDAPYHAVEAIRIPFRLSMLARATPRSCSYPDRDEEKTLAAIQMKEEKCTNNQHFRCEGHHEWSSDGTAGSWQPLFSDDGSDLGTGTSYQPAYSLSRDDGLGKGAPVEESEMKDSDTKQDGSGVLGQDPGH